MKTFLIPVFGNLNNGVNSIDLFCNRDIEKSHVSEISINHIAISFPSHVRHYESVWEIHCNFCTSFIPETRLKVENQLCFERCVPMANFRVKREGKTFAYSNTNFQRVSQVQDHLKFYIIDEFQQTEVKKDFDIYMVVAVRVCE